MEHWAWERRRCALPSARQLAALVMTASRKQRSRLTHKLGRNRPVQALPGFQYLS